MKNLFLLLVSAFVVFFQLSVLGVFSNAQTLPNLTLAFVICLILLQGFRIGVVWAVFAGILIDIGFPWLFGTGALILVIISWLVEKISRFTEIRSLKSVQALALILVLAASSIIFDILGLIFSKIENRWLGKSVSFSVNFISFEYGAKTLITVFAGVLIYFIIRKSNVFSRISA